nr:DUF6660 family protein [uncultured Dyadobacter sp.]
MRTVVTCLMALYVVLLSCIPCQDDVALSFDHAPGRISLHAADDNHQEVVDLCSPFCICACCASVTIATAVSTLPETSMAQLPPQVTFTYERPAYTGDPAGIWQPPKITV